jgi:hypothetical protein
MKIKIFSDEGEKYLKDEMNICVDNLSQKILSDHPNNCIFFKELVDFIVEMRLPHKYVKETSIHYAKNNRFMAKEFQEFLKHHCLNDESPEYYIYDVIRHAFVHFKSGGILEMYKYRDTGKWYPKIIIRKQLGLIDNIDELENETIAYRGMSKNEFDSKSFGQSWTIDENVAREFAFEHYKELSEYMNTIRVVVKTKIQKEFIYHFDKNGREKELIVDERSIDVNCSAIVEMKKV